jgi:methylenetetrahydrofolate dehydrogenase (NADP+) / methenyltetrahydrofolate cyclohydrolase
MSRVLDCRAVADGFFAWAAGEAGKLGRPPRLATVLFRPELNPASRRYRDLIASDARRAGALVDSHDARDEGGLLELVDRLNAAPEVDGIMVFHPLKSALRDEDVMVRISPFKDVEGLHAVNMGYLIQYRRFLDEARGVKCVVPATAKAVVKTLQHYPEIAIEGAFAVIVNNSPRVGKPLGLMLENLGATVVKGFDKTPRPLLEELVRRADILVTAVPDSNFRLDASWIKSGAAVVDVSYEGNLDYAAAAARAGFLTAPDNRVGAVTRAMTFVNLVYCAGNAPLRAARVPRAGA